MNHSKAIFILACLSILSAIYTVSMLYRIQGLETRINLLEARIHWTEVPPEKATVAFPTESVNCLNGAVFTSNEEDARIKSKYPNGAMLVCK